jgi:hypothetical protein
MQQETREKRNRDRQLDDRNQRQKHDNRHHAAEDVCMREVQGISQRRGRPCPSSKVHERTPSFETTKSCERTEPGDARGIARWRERECTSRAKSPERPKEILEMRFLRVFSHSSARSRQETPRNGGGANRSTPGANRSTPGANRSTPGANRSTPGANRSTPWCHKSPP